MPIRKNAIKELRKNRKKHLRNLDIKTDLRKTIKKYLSLIQEKNTKEAPVALQAVFKKIDRAANRHIMHKNTAARRKSTFSRLLLKLA